MPALQDHQVKLLGTLEKILPALVETQAHFRLAACCRLRNILHWKQHMSPRTSESQLGFSGPVQVQEMSCPGDTVYLVDTLHEVTLLLLGSIRGPNYCILGVSLDTKILTCQLWMP